MSPLPGCGSDFWCTCTAIPVCRRAPNKPPFLVVPDTQSTARSLLVSWRLVRHEIVQAVPGLLHGSYGHLGEPYEGPLCLLVRTYITHTQTSAGLPCAMDQLVKICYANSQLSTPDIHCQHDTGRLITVLILSTISDARSDVVKDRVISGVSTAIEEDLSKSTIMKIPCYILTSTLQSKLHYLGAGEVCLQPLLVHMSTSVRRPGVTGHISHSPAKAIL